MTTQCDYADICTGGTGTAERRTKLNWEINNEPEREREREQRINWNFNRQSQARVETRLINELLMSAPPLSNNRIECFPETGEWLFKPLISSLWIAGTEGVPGLAIEVLSKLTEFRAKLLFNSVSGSPLILAGPSDDQVLIVSRTWSRFRMPPTAGAAAAAAVAAAVAKTNKLSVL